MRKQRELKDGALYHVTARANRKEMILDNKGMKDLFLEVIVRAKGKFRFRIENFCVMGNHIHLLIRPGTRESLSRIMAGFQQFVKVFEYIDQNPVEAKQVEDAREWRYGGLWHDRHGYGGIVDGLGVSAALTFPEHGMLRLERR